ncbi:hypothetical protein E6P09_07515 [Haloferax mediterranei ATCC 33500]|uniref:Uncharacterized protein n=1 Tax=Haloferax mediterranei (strain ATCC 33500 / DSM 1411 / JCM 8866 / NBRC 14739 / NCIMB 2177 / R-4) TaxID=523841 RepID=M0IZ11_HALMT|nr:hypothetical protein [Haloferax mediterranei]AHZ22012.1 hypothetical protein BM92_04745 [Haloferax mediterranei ATCC 33500]EMA02107.1 hypothetical protein C439_05990 [Haloferax mediterranei ATCC 33500]MDX5988707.1 hypothetical protein [Haloferax mediterranei ATCC 33500]QCQ75115.1 hypothetical protein E6P09_07515 [Haloferax mediterranei ATCC 33500]
MVPYTGTVIIALLIGFSIAAFTPTSPSTQGVVGVLVSIPVFVALIAISRISTQYSDFRNQVEAIVWELGFIIALLTVGGALGTGLAMNLGLNHADSHISLIVASAVAVIVLTIGYFIDYRKRTSVIRFN